MRKRLFAVAIALVAITAFAAAQTSAVKVTVDVPFGFFVSGKTLPAGTYQFVAGGDLTQVNVTSADGKAIAMTTVITRISPRSEPHGAVVFDVAGNDHYLAEIYIAGVDGFQVPCAPGPHSHTVLKGK